MTLIAAAWQCLVDTARDGAGRLVEHANGQRAVASSWTAAARPGIRDFFYQIICYQPYLYQARFIPLSVLILRCLCRFHLIGSQTCIRLASLRLVCEILVPVSQFSDSSVIFLDHRLSHVSCLGL